MPRIVNCLKAWGAGIGILSFPVIIIYYELVGGSSSWKTLFMLLFSYIPVLLFFEVLVKKYICNFFYWQILILSFLFILLEFVQNIVLIGRTDNKFTIEVIPVLAVLFSNVIAATVIAYMSRENKAPVIIQIDI